MKRFVGDFSSHEGEAPVNMKSVYPSTHSRLEISLTSVVCTYNTFENYIGIGYYFTKYLKESSGFSSDQYLSSKNKMKNVLVINVFQK